MKFTLLLPAICVMSISLLLTGCGKSKLESENGELKTRLENLQQQLQTSNKQIGSQQTQINYLQSELDSAKKLEAEKEQAKTQKINTCIDKIGVRLERLYLDSGHFNFNTDDQEKEEARLGQLENSAKTEIGDIEVDLESAGFTNKDALDNNLKEFYLAHEEMIDASLKMANEIHRTGATQEGFHASMEAGKNAVIAENNIHFLRPDLQAKRINAAQQEAAQEK